MTVSFGSRACVFLYATAAFAQAGSTVSGRVVSTVHGEPVPKVTVAFRSVQEGAAAADLYVCQTGADGRFSISGVLPGLYQPRPSKLGYETRPPGRFATANDFPPFQVEAGQSVTGLEFHLTPQGAISGRILDNDGDPLRNAMVQALQYSYRQGKRSLNPVRSVQANDRGEYRIPHLPPGRYYLRALENGQQSEMLRALTRSGGSLRGTLPLTGFAPTFYPGVPDSAHAAELTVASGLDLSRIDLRLSPQILYAIRGTYAGPTGVEDTQIFVSANPHFRDPGSFNRPANAMAGGGKFELNGVAPGSYTVLIQANPGRNGRPDSLYAADIVEVVNKDVEGVALTLTAGDRISGTVKIEGGTVVNLQAISLMLQNDDMIPGMNQAKINPDGTFEWNNVIPGVYHILATGPQVYLKSLKLGDREIADRMLDTRHLSAAPSLVVGADMGIVQGEVHDADGKPVFNADVTFIPDQRPADWPERFRSAFTTADGKFTIRSLVPGEYRVYAWLAVEPGAPQDPEFRKPFESQAVVVKIAPGARQTLVLKPITGLGGNVPPRELLRQ